MYGLVLRILGDRRRAAAGPMAGVWLRLDRMDPEVLTLAYFQGATVAAIAAAVDRSETEIRGRLRPALGRVAADSKVREAPR